MLTSWPQTRSVARANISSEDRKLRRARGLYVNWFIHDPAQHPREPSGGGGGGSAPIVCPPPLRKRAGDGLSEVGWGSEILYLWSSPKSGNQIVFRVRVVQIRSNFGSCAVRIACPGDVARSTSLFVSRRYAEAGQIARTEGLLASSSVSGPGPL
jgi:hypothetical protein